MSIFGEFSIADTVITPEKAAIVSRLEAMKSKGWEELKGMSGVELEALRDEVDAASVMLAYGHPLNLTRHEAYEAIETEQRQRLAKKQEHEREVQRRETNVRVAAKNIRDAADLIEQAIKIPYEAPRMSELPTLDFGNATDAELAAARKECSRIIDWHLPKSDQDADAVALLKTPASKQVCAELREQAKAEQELDRRARELAAAIAAEQERRKAERAEAERNRQPEAILERIAKLEQLLASEGGSNESV